MTESKYAKYVMREPIDPARFAPAVHVFGENLGGLNCSLVWNCINGPLLMEDKPHKHDFDQLLCFLGGNPMDIKDFGAEVELHLGEEGDKFLIDSSTVVFIPKGLIHCPLHFKKVDKPIMFMYIFLAPSYIKGEVS